MSKKHTIEEVREFVEELGYELISEEYKNAHGKLILKDKEGYMYSSPFYTLSKNKLPLTFGDNNPYKLYNIKLMLQLNGNRYKFVKLEKANSKQNLILTDDYGYYYKTSLGILLRGYNTSFVSSHNPYSIRNIKLWCILNDKSFSVLSDTYINNSSDLKLKCSKEECGEFFESSWEEISQGNGCPYCAGKKIGSKNSLASKNPNLIEEWHPTLNGDLTPYNVAPKSGKKVWWICKNNSDHVWKSSISSRSTNTSCPYCLGMIPSKENNLLICNPNLAKEWCYERNEKQPEEYTPKSSKKVWWKCNECNHEWKASICDRANGSGCPQCANTQSESKIATYVKEYCVGKFGEQDAFLEYKSLKNPKTKYWLKNDVYIKSLKLTIEIHGEQHYIFSSNYHQIKESFIDSQYRDSIKKEFALQNGCYLEIDLRKTKTKEQAKEIVDNYIKQITINN